MKRIAIIPLALGVFVGGVAIKLGLDALQEAKASSTRGEVKVVVATTEIQATSEIDPTMVTVMETPVTPLLGNDSYSTPEEVVGRVVASSIPRGGVVRESLLSPKGTPPGLAVRIEKGYRAVSVKVNEVTGVAYQIRPGAFVDVIAVMTVNVGRRRETVSRIILQDVEVAAVGRTLNASADSDGKGKAAKSVTLLVKDSDAPKLHLAQTRGKLTLALRADDDKLEAEAGHATEGELLDGFEDRFNGTRTPPVTAAASGRPGGARAVTVVQGGKAYQHQFGAGPSQGLLARDVRPEEPTLRIEDPAEDDAAEENDGGGDFPPRRPG